MGSEITLRDIYDAQMQTDRRVAELAAEVAAHNGRVDERLDHGSRKMDDLEKRLRVLEAAGARGSGRNALISHVATFFGSSTAAAVVSYLISHH